jgi:hypothetical protein
MADAAVVLEAQVDEMNELIDVIKEELGQAKSAGDTVEEFDLRRELERAIDRRRQLAAELHLVAHPHKRVGATRRERRVCPDCGQYHTVTVLITATDKSAKSL